VLSSPSELVGNTPMVQYIPEGKAFGQIVCKLEMMNGSKRCGCMYQSHQVRLLDTASRLIKCQSVHTGCLHPRKLA
jgi:hypothetical protein